MIGMDRGGRAAPRRRRPLAGGGAVVVLLFFALLLAACSAGGGDAAAGEGEGGPSVEITEPTADASVTAPFTVTVTASDPLGPTESGQRHVHIWFDDNEDDYLVVESDTVQITDAPAGQHTMHVSLRNANHSPAGADTEVQLTIGGSGGGQPNESAPAESEPEYTY
jgi:hypothetical protein